MIEALGWVFALVAAVPFFMTDVRMIRRLSVVSSSLGMAYSILIGAWPVLALNLLILGANLYYIRKDARGRLR